MIIFWRFGFVRFLLIALTYLNFCTSNIAVARTLKDKHKYFYIFELGFSVGGFQSSMDLQQSFPSPVGDAFPKNFSFDMNGSGATGLNGLIGWEFIHTNGLYLGFGASFVANFLPNSTGSSISKTVDNWTYEVSGQNFYFINANNIPRQSGTNAFANIMAFGRIGYGVEKFGIYFVGQIGYLSMPATVGFSKCPIEPSGTCSVIGFAKTEIGGFAVMGGIGGYFFPTEIIGIGWSFVAGGSPYHSASLGTWNDPQWRPNSSESSIAPKGDLTPTVNHAQATVYTAGVSIILRI